MSALPLTEDAVQSENQQPLLQVENLGKTFRQGGQSLTIFNRLSLSLARGEMIGLVGPSGAGKSTLMHIIGLLDSATAGKIVIDGRDAARLSESERTRLRRDSIGFVYQFHYLQPEFSAIENVAMPLIIAGRKKKEAHLRAAELLGDLGLGHRHDHRPARLSGGEQQRVAIARALAIRPQILLADEPTGNLDPETSAGVFEMLIKLVRNSGIGALIATHNLELAARMDKVLEIRGGQLIVR